MRRRLLVGLVYMFKNFFLNTKHHYKEVFKNLIMENFKHKQEESNVCVMSHWPFTQLQQLSTLKSCPVYTPSTSSTLYSDVINI